MIKSEGDYMLKDLLNSLSTTAVTFCGFLGGYLNQLPDKARQVKARVYVAPPWSKLRMQPETNHLNKDVHSKRKKGAHSEEKIFNHPRR